MRHNYQGEMRLKRRLMLALLPLLAGTSSVALHSQTSIVTPKLSGVVSDVSKLDTAKVLTQMNEGASNNDLVLVAAHRGYWVNAPENSDPALKAAFNSGVEAIEIDLRTTSDGVIVVSHDADLIKETTGSGFVSETSWSTINGLQLRDRKGVPQDLKMLRFEDVLNILNLYSSNGFGPVIIADIKDPSPWPTYQAGLALVQQMLPSATQPAVVFKMKMRSFPSIDAVQTEAQSHPNFGHLLPVVNPEDATGIWGPTTSNFQTLRNLSTTSPHFIQQFELNINTVNDGAAQYPAPVGPLASFATYYQPSFYPEGVSTIVAGNTLCCYSADTTTDKRGILSFSLFYSSPQFPGISLITSDNLAETLNFLNSTGRRNVSAIQ